MTTINPSDWEMLSAYLDNELPPHERAQLKARLKNDPDLRQAFVDLRQVRHTLRSQPRLRAPRNFTLTPQMAGMRAGVRPGGLALSPTYPVLRLASILATIFFVLVSAGSLYVRMYGPSPRQVALSQPQDMVQEAPRPFGMGGGGGGVSEPPMSAMAEPETTEAAALEAPAAPDTAEPGAQRLEVTPEAGEAAAVTEAQAALPNSKMPPGRAPDQPVQDPAALEHEAARQALAWTVLAIVQALLALLAIGAGAAALYLRYFARR